MSKMSDFTYAISRHRGVSQRTVRRWCAEGKLKGVYRTKGGHWRLVGPRLKQLRQADEHFRTASPEEKKIYKASLDQNIKWLKELNAVLQTSLALNNGTSALRQERNDVPIRELLHPRAIETVEHPCGLLMIHAERLLANHTAITPRSLAASLGCAVSTLYERYKQPAVKRACSLGQDHAPDTVLTRTDKKRNTQHNQQSAPAWLAKHPRKLRRVA
jgi:hypothetical protein